jgi:ABC-type polar amino acid transport system ATPase subunit
LAHTIELRKVSKYYATEDSVSMGFSRVDLELDIGEFVAITGESGSGKSTLLNVISGLDTYEEGEMFVCGEDTSAYGTEDYERYRKTYIGNIFQDFNLINSYTVYQNIELILWINDVPEAEIKERVPNIIEKVGLTEFTKTKVSKLSGGQKQRVSIARALALKPKILFFDEPTSALDPELTGEILKVIKELAKEKMTMVIVTHEMAFARDVANHVIFMDEGVIVEEGSPEDLFGNTRIDRTKQFLARFKD